MESQNRKRGSPRSINVGGVTIGGGAPVAVQSMTNTNTADIGASLAQLSAFAEAGCHIARLAVPDMEAAGAFEKIRARSPLPLVADIHFDYRLALAAVDAGADKIRINPGNIGSRDKIAAVAAACKKAKIPIRVGVNSGSVSKNILEKFGGPTVGALLESARENISDLTALGFEDICLSIKASDVQKTIRANLEAAALFPYPLHIGVTEAGFGENAILKSAVGIGALLAMGVGDTVRVSLTGDPAAEIPAAYDIIRAAGLSDSGIEIVSCPTCGRCRVDLERLARELSEAVKGKKTDKKLTVAVMGCAVNGPGEAREADIGLAGGDGKLLLFIKGKPAYSVEYEKALPALLEELSRLL